MGLCILILLPLVYSYHPLNENDRCHLLPIADFISSQQIDFICHHRDEWIKQRDGIKLDPPTNKQMDYLRDIELCSKSDCIRKENRGKRQTQKTIRKEIRMMSDEERKRLFKAMRIMKEDLIDDITTWDLHTLVHYPDSAPGAHWGPAFLPWHREFLRQFEIALQKIDPTVSLPYWDSTLDHGLPDPADSILWTDNFLGNGNGYVKTGPFKDWNTNVLMPLSTIPVNRLYRSTGGRSGDRLLSPHDIEWITSRKNFSDLTFCHDKTFESMHGLSHVWVGGFMFVIRVSPNDPTFYMHHAFIDYVWEQFRKKRQSREDRETQWATDTCNKLHGFDEQMKPFRMQNRDGLSNQYTDQWYDYEKVDTCSIDHPQCNSEYLFCDPSEWRCRSRIVYGGNCTGFEKTQICYNSVCIKGKCELPPRVAKAKRLKTDRLMMKHDIVWTKTLLLDTKGNGLKQSDASVQIINDMTGENMTVYSENSIKYPEIEGLVYIPIPKPHAGLIQNVTLEVRDGYGRYCQSHCYNTTAERYQVCQPKLRIGHRADTSSPISFTHSTASRRYLDVDLSVHRTLSYPSTPYIVFACSRKMMTSAMITSLAERTKAEIKPSDEIFFRVTFISQSSNNLQIECSSDNTAYPSWISSIRHALSPFHPNILYVKAPNPSLFPDGINVQIRVKKDGTDANCSFKCTRPDGSVIDCDGRIHLSDNPLQSEEDIFTSEESSLSVLGWNMRGHPSNWRHKVPYLSLYC